MSRTALAMPEAARGEELTPVTPAGGSGARQLDGSPCHASGCLVRYSARGASQELWLQLVARWVHMPL